MGADLGGQYFRDVLPDQGSASAHAAGQRDHPASINADMPNPHLSAYATSKGAIQNFTAGLAQLLAEKGIRVNSVAPGPVWTRLILSTMPADAVAHFGEQVPMKRPAQPRELAPVFVLTTAGERVARSITADVILTRGATEI
jgi:NAD(P)-dependent dehydrogenase (short-subunit alcohol dehydrogenase family)